MRLRIYYNVVVFLTAYKGFPVITETELYIYPVKVLWLLSKIRHLASPTTRKIVNETGKCLFLYLDTCNLQNRCHRSYVRLSVTIVAYHIQLF